MNSRVLIIGGGVAGARAAAALRELGFDGTIDLVCAEARLPYDRPPLSKECLLRPGSEPTLVNAGDFYASANVALHLGTAAMVVNTHTRTVALADRTARSYDWLILATGGSAHRFDVPGANLDGITTLRCAEDSMFIGQRLGPHSRVVIVGGGFVGLETAAAARARGSEVTVIESGSRLMARCVPPEISHAFAALHAAHGVRMRFGVQAVGFEGHGQVRGVRLANGAAVEADLVVVGIGMTPDVELARTAGLLVEDGVMVDREGRTSDPRIFAVGDCARSVDPVLGGHRRLESWEAARAQAYAAACAIVGRPVPAVEPAWLWSQQYDALLQIAGATARGGRTVVRGDPGRMDFIVFEVLNDRVIGASAVNRGREMSRARRLMARAACVESDELADEARPLRAVCEAIH